MTPILTRKPSAAQVDAVRLNAERAALAAELRSLVGDAAPKNAERCGTPMLRRLIAAARDAQSTAASAPVPAPAPVVVPAPAPVPVPAPVVVPTPAVNPLRGKVSPERAAQLARETWTNGDAKECCEGWDVSPTLGAKAFVQALRDLAGKTPVQEQRATAPAPARTTSKEHAQAAAKRKSAPMAASDRAVDSPSSPARIVPPTPSEGKVRNATKTGCGTAPMVFVHESTSGGTVFQQGSITDAIAYAVARCETESDCDFVADMVEALLVARLAELKAGKTTVAPAPVVVPTPAPVATVAANTVAAPTAAYVPPTLQEIAKAGMEASARAAEKAETVDQWKGSKGYQALRKAVKEAEGLHTLPKGKKATLVARLEKAGKTNAQTVSAPAPVPTPAPADPMAQVVNVQTTDGKTVQVTVAALMAALQTVKAAA